MKHRSILCALSLLLSFTLLLGGCAGIKAPDNGSSETEPTPQQPAPEGALPPNDDDPRKVVVLEDTSDVLVNPGKGFMHYGDTEYERTKELMPLIGTGYHRFNWCDLVDENGQYDFTKIHDWMHTYNKFGRPFGFGVMAVNTSSSKEYITPKFVFDNGAKFFIHTEGDNTQYIPDWRDPVFLQEVERLATELGKEFNGDKNISFVEILSYGNWGEQHLFGIETGDPDYRKNQSISSEFFRDHYAKPYLEAFPDTVLYNPWGTEEFDEMYLELADEGIALRRDGIVKYTNGLDTLAATYGKLPTAFEFAESYKKYKDGREEYFNERLEEAIAIAKPSYLEFDPDWYADNEDYAKELANRLGYYFRFKQAKFSEKIRLGEETTVTLSFRNDGIAPIYEPCKVYLGLLDESGNLVKKFKTDIDPKDWMPDVLAEENVKVTFSGVDKGTYWLAVGLYREETDEAPTYLLGSKNLLNSGAWYAFGQTTVE